jgi:hypothetical protein
MAVPSGEKLICDKFNLEALAVNQVKSFKALADGKDVFIEEDLIVLYYIDCMMFYMLLYYCTLFCIDVFCS